MFKIVLSRRLNPQVKLICVEAPLIAKKAKPGQFVMLRIDTKGERIPLTIADTDAAGGTITLVFQEIGKTTIKLGKLERGDYIMDIAGPLGIPSELSALNGYALSARTRLRNSLSAGQSACANGRRGRYDSRLQEQGTDFL